MVAKQLDMQTMITSKDFDKLPSRLFIDSTVLQTLQSYGEFIYDGGAIASHDRIYSIPNGLENVNALKNIMFVGRRALFELVLSHHSLEEVSDRGNPKYLDWAHEICAYWSNQLVAYEGRRIPAFSGHGAQRAKVLASSRFDYLSKKDRALLVDALKLECNAFITMDRRLARNATHLETWVPIRVLEPVGFWDLLQPWTPLFV